MLCLNSLCGAQSAAAFGADLDDKMHYYTLKEQLILMDKTSRLGPEIPA